MGRVFLRDIGLLVFVSVMALIANSSALVWGPNMAFLLQKRRPLARSIAYTAGRGLTLTVVYVPAVILWTILGTATLWGPAVAFLLAPGWATKKFKHLTDRIPTIKPWQVALPLGMFGVLFAAFGIWKATRG